MPQQFGRFPARLHPGRVHIKLRRHANIQSASPAFELHSETRVRHRRRLATSSAGTSFEVIPVQRRMPLPRHGVRRRSPVRRHHRQEHELEIVFDTVDRSRKYRNLKACGECSITMWIGEVTVQYEGIAEEPVGADLDRYQEAYFKKLPDGRDRLSWPGIAYFVVHPKWVRYSDFNARPPLIEEFSFD
jgi:hypothetical protein